MLFRTVFLLLAVAFAFAEQNIRTTVPHYGEKFVLGKHTYSSKHEFILSGKRCGTEELSEVEMDEIEYDLASVPDSDEFAKGGKVRIPVYFHVIKNTNGDGDLSETDIANQIEVMNTAFKKTNFKFWLKDVDVTVNDDWFSLPFQSQEEKEMKSTLRRGGKKALNIYTVENDQGILGWATFPPAYKNKPDEDGVVIDVNTLPGGTFAPYNEGITLVHEVGHWMGLYHTFQNGCNKAARKGDKVGDTPAVKSPNFGCPPDDTDSCPGNKRQLKGNDLVHNYMDYGDDSCLTSFTYGQNKRMDRMWQKYRM